MINLNQKSKLIIFPILYWLIFIVTPIIIAYIFKDDRSEINISGSFMLFVVFIAPFFYLIPYKLSKLEGKKQKLFFILFGLVVPYFFLYSYLYFQVVENFKNSRFPF